MPAHSRAGQRPCASGPDAHWPAAAGPRQGVWRVRGSGSKRAGDERRLHSPERSGRNCAFSRWRGGGDRGHRRCSGGQAKPCSKRDARGFGPSGCFFLGVLRDRKGRGASTRAAGSDSGVGPDIRRVPSMGLQPHAPTTVAVATYQWLLEQGEFAGMPLSTHLAETADEHRVHCCPCSQAGRSGTFWNHSGLWDDGMLAEIGHGKTPVGHLAEVSVPGPVCRGSRQRRIR